MSSIMAKWELSSKASAGLGVFSIVLILLSFGAFFNFMTTHQLNKQRQTLQNKPFHFIKAETHRRTGTTLTTVEWEINRSAPIKLEWTSSSGEEGKVVVYPYKEIGGRHLFQHEIRGHADTSYDLNFYDDKDKLVLNGSFTIPSVFLLHFESPL